MANKSTTVEKVSVPSNPGAVNWPSDPMGVTSMFKKEGVRAAGRVNGHKDKLDLLLSTIEVLKEHALARYKAQVVINKTPSKSAIDRAEREARAVEKTRQQALVKAKQEVDRLEKAGSSKEAK